MSVVSLIPSGHDNLELCAMPRRTYGVRTSGALCEIDEGVVTPDALSSTEVTLRDAYEGTLVWGLGIFSFKGISSA